MLTNIPFHFKPAEQEKSEIKGKILMSGADRGGGRRAVGEGEVLN